MNFWLAFLLEARGIIVAFILLATYGFLLTFYTLIYLGLDFLFLYGNIICSETNISKDIIL